MAENLTDREDWLRISAAGIARAYGSDEPEYSLADIKDQNGAFQKMVVARKASLGGTPSETGETPVLPKT